MKDSENYIKTVNLAISFARSEKIISAFLLNEIKKISSEKYVELKDADSILLKSELIKLIF